MWWQTDGSEHDPGLWVYQSGRWQPQTGREQITFEQSGEPLVGCEYPGAPTPLRMVTVNGVTDTRNKAGNYATIGVSGFTGGIVSVMPVEGAVVSHAEGSPASNLTGIRVKFVNGAGSAVSGLVRFTLFAVG